jgi:hypothetical protein
MSGVKSVRTILLCFNETLDKHKLVPNFLKDLICSFYHPIPSGRSSKGSKFFIVLVENFYYTGSRLCRLAHNETSVSRKILIFQQRLAIKETIA